MIGLTSMVAIANAFRQILGGFGLMFLFAFLTWAMSQGWRGVGGGRFGNSYCHFVAPGVMFHELNYALGCLLTTPSVRKAVCIVVAMIVATVARNCS